jgi:hypothetical protein
MVLGRGTITVGISPCPDRIGLEAELIIVGMCDFNVRVLRSSAPCDHDAQHNAVQSCCGAKEEIPGHGRFKRLV